MYELCFDKMYHCFELQFSGNFLNSFQLQNLGFSSCLTFEYELLNKVPHRFIFWLWREMILFQLNLMEKMMWDDPMMTQLCPTSRN